MTPLYRPDWHSPSHIFGSFFLASLFGHLPGFDALGAAALALLFGIMWELLDAAFPGEWIFDPRGGDIGDVLADAVGCALSIWI